MFVVCISAETKNTDSFHLGSFEVNILMRGSELFDYYLWVPAAFPLVKFKHKAHSSSLVSHWIPFMKILNLSVNNSPLLLWLLLLCFSVLFHFNINSDGLLSLLSVFFPVLDCFFVCRSGGRLSDPSLPLNPCFCHAKLTATLWVNAACWECWDKRGVSDRGTTNENVRHPSCSEALLGLALTTRPNRNIFCLKMTILSIWERSGSMWCFI